MVAELIGAAMLALSGAGASDDAYPAVAARGDGSLPAGCAPRQVAGLVGSFLARVNRGDARAAVRIMDPLAGPANQRPRGWYSVTEKGRHFVAYRRAPLVRYFARRHRHGERMRLLKLSVVSGGKRSVGVEYRIRRSADDVRSRAAAIGKAAIDCPRQKIFVWSMSQPSR